MNEELIKLRGHYTTLELAEILDVAEEDVIKWEETGNIDEHILETLKEIYEEEREVNDYIELANFKKRNSLGLRIWVIFPYPIIVLALYLVFGFTKGLWHPLWSLFLTIPFYYSLGVTIFKKSIKYLSFFACLCIIYMALGLIFDLWHPYWLILLLAVIYYDMRIAISLKLLPFISLFILCSIIYLFLGLNYQLWHPYWLIFLSEIPYEIVRIIYIKKNKKTA